MVHAQDCIELSVGSSPEHRVRAERPRERGGRECGSEEWESGIDQASLLVTQIPLFSGMGIESRHGDTGRRNPAPLKKGSKERSDAHDLLRCEQ